MLPIPDSPERFAELCLKAGILAAAIGVFTVHRGLRRVDPSDIIEGTVTTVRTDQSGNSQATIQFMNRQRGTEKCLLTMEYHPSLGEIVPLILRANDKVPKLHVINKTATIIWGVVLIALGLLSVSLRWLVLKNI